ncbi:DUF202 domain-containing protein [Salegentibacter chungangensis]|uniref:DUF202 domain-containing protein n=1 Tax=Salegentibacter chungangensis TaxID=1335724 RepID=A0ABW3NRN9_9FLAO
MRRVKLHNPFKSRIIDEELIREHLALERTKLANERTLLSYIRASLYLLLGGLALIQLKAYDDTVKWIGYSSLVVSVIFITIGISRYLVLLRKLNKLLRTDKRRPENND